MNENTILFVLKMLMHEKTWCHHVTFEYDYTDLHLSTISFFIGPIQFTGQIIRNKPEYLNSLMFFMPSFNDEELMQPNNFFIFIDEFYDTACCIMVHKHKILEYKHSKPTADTNTFIIDKEFLYKNHIWISPIAEPADLMVLYPEKFK